MNQPDFVELVDLASERLGGMALCASDEFFAEKENLLKPGRGVFKPDAYTDRGKWMDGWETRRRRSPGHDWCIIRLGLSGVIEGVDIDTNHFLGNHPATASVEALRLDEPRGPADFGDLDGQWITILEAQPLERGSQNLFAVASQERWTHLRLNIFPDGGVARLKVHGRVLPPWELLRKADRFDLAAIENGGRAVLANDAFFSSKDNVLMPGQSAGMFDGWETRRRRGPGHDWLIVQLGTPGEVEHIKVQTHHFKGNYPDRCRIEGCYLPGARTDALRDPDVQWREILPESKLMPHANHTFEPQLAKIGPVSHVRLSIFPDGGISRLRIIGKPMPESGEPGATATSSQPTDTAR